MIIQTHMSISTRKMKLIDPSMSSAFESQPKLFKQLRIYRLNRNIFAYSYSYLDFRFNADFDGLFGDKQISVCRCRCVCECTQCIHNILAHVHTRFVSARLSQLIGLSHSLTHSLTQSFIECGKVFMSSHLSVTPSRCGETLIVIELD